MSSKSTWNKLICRKEELQLIGTLNGGQSFRWKKIKTEDEPLDQWVGIFSGCIWWLMQNNDHLLFKVYDPSEDDCGKSDGTMPKRKKLNNDSQNEKDSKYLSMLRKYFQLDLNLTDYYSKWSEADPNFKKASEQFYGIRILAQDPVENLFSFICSQNNHINRISTMVEKLCSMYGKKISEIDSLEYYSFPTVEALTNADVENELRLAGFGYRARYIKESAIMIKEMGGELWFDKLKNMDYKCAKTELCKLTGIGAKVADCICLMSLGHLEAIPVDTHVFQIACANYLPHLSKCKSVTDKVYNEIGDHFRTMYGPLAGWAHTILFCADLKKFQNGEKKAKTKSKCVR